MDATEITRRLCCVAVQYSVGCSRNVQAFIGFGEAFPTRRSVLPTSTAFNLPENQMNISATFSVFKLFRDPALCLPHSTVSTFNQLPIPLSKAFVKQHGEKDVDIRAVVLDKDNCFAKPKENVVHSQYKVHIPMFPTCISAVLHNYSNYITKHMVRSNKIFWVELSHKRMVVQAALVSSDFFPPRQSLLSSAKPTQVLVS